MVKKGINKNFFRVLHIVWWSCVAATTMVLLIAAVKNKNETECAGLEIDINGSADGQWFVEKKDIIKMLTLHGTERIKGKPIHRFDLKKMEARLRKNIWIRHAELFFNSKNVLQIKVIERVPVARLFTIQGNSFYIDSSGRKLPLSSKIAVKLPVFTGFPFENVSSAKDSFLLTEVKKLGCFILQDTFWMSQISQIDITAARKYEMIPTVGSHIIQFGSGDNIEKKFHKLMMFYKQVLVNSGFEKYKKIDIQFEGQVIAVKKDDPQQKTIEGNN